MDTTDHVIPAGALLLNRTHMPFALDRGVAGRAAIGLINHAGLAALRLAGIEDRLSK